MPTLYIARTPAAKNFREKTGQANYRLNTIIVGLESVKAGTAKKPSDLAVGWNQPVDGQLAASKARAFATNAFMVHAIDSVDGYMRRLGIDRVWFANDPIGPALRGEFVTDHSQSVPYLATSTDDLIAELERIKHSPKEVETHVREFSSKFFGRRKRPGMGKRFDALTSKTPNVPKCYVAAVQLLISWRNKHVHGDSSQTISAAMIDDLTAAGSYFYSEHSHLDIQQLVARYLNSDAPTLKDVSSLISVSHRAIEVIDRKLLADIDVEAIFNASVKATFLNDADRGEKRLKQYWGKSVETRAGKLAAIGAPFGFTKVDSNSPPDAFYLPAKHLLNLATMDRDKFSEELGILDQAGK